MILTWDHRTHRRQIRPDPSLPISAPKNEVWITLGDASVITLPPALGRLWQQLRHAPLPLSEFHTAWAAADPHHHCDARLAFASGLLFLWPHFQDQSTPINWETLTLGRIPQLPFVDPWHLPPAVWTQPFSVRSLATFIEMTQGLPLGTGITSVTTHWAELLHQESVVAYYHGPREWIVRYLEHAQGFRSTLT